MNFKNRVLNLSFQIFIYTFWIAQVKFQAKLNQICWIAKILLALWNLSQLPSFSKHYEGFRFAICHCLKQGRKIKIICVYNCEMSLEWCSIYIILFSTSTSIYLIYNMYNKNQTKESHTLIKLFCFGKQNSYYTIIQSMLFRFGKQN